MSTIANLRVVLSASTDQFTSAMKGVGDQVRKVGLAAAGVAVGFGAIVSRGLSVADELNKMATRTGASVGALSALKHQASLSDVALGELERGLLRMRRSVGEAMQGTKAQADAFRTLGINVRWFAKLRPEQQLGVLADRLNALKDPAKAAAVGQDIFGRAYERMLPILVEGSKGMREAAAEAKRLGLILTDEGANGATKAIDAMDKLKNSLAGTATIIATQLAPDIEKFANFLVEKMPAAIDKIKNLKEPIEAISDAMKTLGDWIDVITERWRFAVEGLKMVFRPQAQLIGGVAAAFGQLQSGNARGAMDIASSIPGDIVRLFTTLPDRLEAIQGDDSAEMMKQTAILERSRDYLFEITRSDGTRVPVAQ